MDDTYGNIKDFSIVDTFNPDYLSKDQLTLDEEEEEHDINEFVKKNVIESHNGGNFETIQKASDYVLTLGELFTRNPSLISIETAIGSRLMAPNKIFFAKALETFDSNRTILISFESLDDNSCYFMWRFKNCHQFMCLWIQSNDVDIVDFIKKFLFSSLKHGHNGLISSFTYAADVINIDLNYFSIGDSRDFNLLALTCLSGDLKAVKFCLQQGFDVNLSIKGQTPIELAYNARNYEIVYELLKANSQFPDKFDTSDASDDIKKFIEMVKTMHESIKRDDAEKVKEIIIQNPNLRHFYDLENNSALSCMMAHEKFKAYETFVTNNIFFGPKENIDGILRNITNLRLRRLNKINQKYGKESIQKHIHIIMANSFVGYETDNLQEKLNHVARAVKVLNENVLISPILRAVAATRNFTINFDFSREAFRHFKSSDEPYKNGTYQYSGRVQIAAKFLLDASKENIVIGSLAHELCHLAMVAVFNNFGNPFTEDDFQTAKSFEGIVEDCKAKKDMKELMALIFQRYPPEMRAAELIAAVPHMIAHYHNSDNAMTDFKIPYATLFYYYQEQVVTELKKSEVLLESSADVKSEFLVVVKDQTVLKSAFFAFLAILLILAIAMGGLLTYYNSSIYIEVNLGEPMVVGEYKGKNQIKCEYKSTNYSEYRCVVYNVMWKTEKDSFIHDAIGHHADGKLNTHVTRFCIANKTVVVFPQNLGEVLPNLIDVFLSDLEMQFIPKNSFKGLNDLSQVDLSDNKISYIETEVFAGTPIRRILLPRNQIMKIFPNAFKDLEISTLEFLNNKCHSGDVMGSNEVEKRKKIDTIVEKCSCDYYDDGKCFAVDSETKSVIVTSMFSGLGFMIMLLLGVVLIAFVFYQEKRKIQQKNVDGENYEMSQV